MAKRKPRKPYRPHGRGRTLREVLEIQAAEYLADEALSVLEGAENVGAEAGVDAVVAHAAEHLTHEDEHKDDAEYARVWEIRIAELVYDIDDLQAHVHRFLDRNPIYVLATPSELERAVWADLLHTEVSKVVDRVIHQTDANGQQRYLEDNGLISRNPNFVEPD